VSRVSELLHVCDTGQIHNDHVYHVTYQHRQTPHWSIYMYVSLGSALLLGNQNSISLIQVLGLFIFWIMERAKQVVEDHGECPRVIDSQQSMVFIVHF
jgi:hypothetical protein